MYNAKSNNLCFYVPNFVGFLQDCVRFDFFFNLEKLIDSDQMEFWKFWRLFWWILSGFGVEWNYTTSWSLTLQKSQKMRLTKIIEFRIMADHYDQKCHVLILFKNKIIKKVWGVLHN